MSTKSVHGNVFIYVYDMYPFCLRSSRNHIIHFFLPGRFLCKAFSVVTLANTLKMTLRLPLARAFVAEVLMASAREHWGQVSGWTNWLCSVL